MLLCRTLVVLAILTLGTHVRAAQLGTEGEPLSIDVHAFVSQGFLLSTANNFLANSNDGSFQFTELGINFTKQLTDKLRVGLQLFSRQLGPLGNFSAKADWYYLDYRWRDWLGFRAGRVKVPFGLYNDTSDIDSARVPVLLPQSIYPATSRDFLLAQTGVELYGYVPLRRAGALDYHVYGGTLFFEVPATTGTPYTIGNLNTPYLVGTRVLWEPPVEGLRVGGSLQALRLDTTLTFPMPAGSVNIEVPAILTVGSIEYAVHDLLLAAEYSRWYVDIDSSNAMLFPPSHTVSERAYGLATYRLRSWLAPSLYYSLLFTDVNNRSGSSHQQHDVAATVRFDVNSFWLIKLEAHYMHGTAALTPTLNDNKPLTMLEGDWGLFLVKTTAYF